MSFDLVIKIDDVFFYNILKISSQYIVLFSHSLLYKFM